MSTRFISWGKWRPVRKADNLTTFYVPNVMEIWEPKSPGTLWATPGLLRDCCTYFIYNRILPDIRYSLPVHNFPKKINPTQIVQKRGQFSMKTGLQSAILKYGFTN
jgi:hypothetical protein